MFFKFLNPKNQFSWKEDSSVPISLELGQNGWKPRLTLAHDSGSALKKEKCCR